MPPMGRPPRGPRPDGPEEEFNLEQMEKETEEMLKLRYLTKDNAVFERTEGGFVSVRIGEEFHPRVQVVRMFPFSDPDQYISIRTPDERSKEIGIIENMKQVSKETAEMLREQLALRYFTPIITKIINIKDEYGYAYFDVVTDRGACRFTINMGGHSVVHLSETRILISDIDENRFEIPDVTKLTTKELKKLDLFL
ncbi:MAG: DUF1854 domain-containing protein [Lachnospiraceae bacterium]|nr:DUF1854 domain-containing protein [Lachnospiraceae bacterium]